MASNKNNTRNSSGIQRSNSDSTLYTFNGSQPAPLLEYLLNTIGESRSKTKAILQGHGIRINGKVVPIEGRRHNKR